ncbi:hypothetical protein SAMN05216559_2577 [Halomicrobium zhouii]|uniref:Uncharacterized protein n=1 Tax=Halomicrobium zhouii TaxID=767519 RepID=A0A1I6LET1_9EURY|nr:hypothetical protein [Halomicrobium zhouii]SFS01971.1 hypothetical protein SAMN05216559_2577 [Halomicrobium zhouii]
MEVTADELAGVVDVFGTLTRSELSEALSELAFKRADELERPDDAIDDAVASYHLVGYDHPESGDGGDAERLLVPGPTAFPEIPEGGADLPHIMDVPERDVDREALTAAVADRFREESVVAIRSDNPEFIDRLLDVSYELEVWGDVDVSGARDQLVEAQEE